MLDTATHTQMMARVEPLITEALTRKTGDLPPPLGANTLTRAAHKDAVFIGALPEHLRGLCYLHAELKAEVEAECHRRCVAQLGSETYDDEHVEFQVYCNVTSDPQFAGSAVVVHRLCEEIEKTFPATKGTAEHIYTISISPNWDLYLIGMVENMRIDGATCPWFGR